MALFRPLGDVKSMLQLYSTFIDNAIVEDREKLYELLKEAVREIEPDFKFDGDSPLTAYEVFTLICDKENVTYDNAPLDVEGYEANVMEYTEWDPDAPVDDSKQFPDHENIDTREEPQ